MNEVPSAGGAYPVSASPSGSQSGRGPLDDEARLRSLAQSGLGAQADPEMQAVAERVRQWVGVPVALVSLVQPDQQVFPGMTGLPEPWATARCMPLTHSFCRHVVTTAEPLIVSDAREHPLLGHTPAVHELGAVAYAGMPLTDEAGAVLGSLCAIDGVPRQWTPVELDLLRGLAESCSSELRLRLARFSAHVERGRRDELEQQLRSSFDRSQALLAASEAFSDTVTVDDVRHRVGELVTTDLRPSYVGLSLLDSDGRLRRVHDARFSPCLKDTGPWLTYDLSTSIPTATALRERRIVAYADRPSFDEDHPEAARRLLRDLGLHAVAAIPLPHADGSLAALVLGWDQPRRLEAPDLLTLTALAGYAAQALDRAQRLHHRDSVAHQLQQAMLTTLPTVPGLIMSARYQPADSREDVGGDWYDAAPVPVRDDSDARHIAVSVGDVIGHTLTAATVMGQVRSMLRQAGWDHPGEPPSRTLEAFERAAVGVGLHATGTALLAHLQRCAGGQWRMTWTNAGHPPPILLVPGDAATLLDGHDILFGFPTVATGPRHDEHCDLVPGTTLFLYTDGLVERRGSDIDAGTDRLRQLLDDNRDRAPKELVDLAVDSLAHESPDDVVAFAVHVVRPDRPSNDVAP
jgi:GAF domain-containing protein